MVTERAVDVPAFGVAGRGLTSGALARQPCLHAQLCGGRLFAG
jgi:hypothetical protein